MKRSFDLIASLLGLIAISPLLLLIAFFLRLSKEGEVFYLQERVGQGGRPFRIFKFATMLKDSPRMGTKTMTLRGDPRITPIGRYLRITKLNELPQLLNVLRGEMSFVGARPLPKKSFERYQTAVQQRIYATPPGITGIGSIVFRDEEKLLTIFREQGGDPQKLFTEYIYPYKGRLEMWYQDHVSVCTDLRILLLTFWQIMVPSSSLVFRLFPDLPKRPYALTLEGLRHRSVEPAP
jgi:lipopolysaccharide/colanic/teichoic acid biosynthesis glycosyltransferase